MSYLDQATVTEILKHRPVFIVTRWMNGYDSSDFEIVATQFDFKIAALKAVQHAFSNTECDGYDPHSRFSRHRDHKYESGAWVNVVRWTDGYSRYRHMHGYTIHEWLPDTGPVSKKSFGFDVWFKRKIAAERPSCSTVKQWIADWKASLNADKMPDELFDRIQLDDVGRGDDAIGGEREEWVAKYGSKGLPWSDMEDIPPLPAYA